MVEYRESEEKLNQLRIVFLIGRGSRLPNILDKILPGSPIRVTLVVSHRKLEEGNGDVPGVAYAKKMGIPAIYWNLVQMRKADFDTFAPPAMKEDSHAELYREKFMKLLGAFIFQPYYKPDLIFMTGWNLVLDYNFTSFFQKENIPILNVHPHPLPNTNEPQDEITAPDGKKIPVLRGTEVWVKAIEQKLPWSGVTIHQVIPEEYDVGLVVASEWVKIDPKDTDQTLREKLNEIEDRIVPQTILDIATGKPIPKS